MALAAADGGARATYLALLGRACGDAGESAAAKRVLQQAMAIATEARTAASAQLALGVVLHDAGELDAAVAALEAARDRFAVQGREVEAALARGHLGWIAAERGSAAEAYALLADAGDVARRAGREEWAAYFSSEAATATASTSARR